MHTMGVEQAYFHHFFLWIITLNTPILTPAFADPPCTLVAVENGKVTVSVLEGGGGGDGGGGRRW